MLKRILEISVAFPMLFLTGCSAWVPELANIIDSVEDTAVCVEVNADAMQEDTDIIISVQVINKDPPKLKVAQ